LGEFGLQAGLLWPPALYGARANIEEGGAPKGGCAALGFLPVFRPHIRQGKAKGALAGRGAGDGPPLDPDYILSILCLVRRAKKAILLSYCIY
jgi:hypothetical protein